ncbi:CLUMA_CG016661, isoform A [Clunio marinus]|uniref:CLUMA_CG016661, isoform A n=1 Tax=Clunio marinus TaxID=568069 RepID=A0A1J1IT65_9DIPT|nr:CLUMA_CG016661, isoform A [Clunio marinus]
MDENFLRAHFHIIVLRPCDETARLKKNVAFSMIKSIVSYSLSLAFLMVTNSVEKLHLEPRSLMMKKKDKNPLHHNKKNSKLIFTYKTVITSVRESNVFLILVILCPLRTMMNDVERIE